MEEPTTIVHAGGLKTHEDAEGELGFFWSTKIGGPSHGFDYEGQCILPLLANARNKVLLISDSAWSYPIGRAHLRMLWTASEAGVAPEPRLWLEAINSDFDARDAGVVDMARLTQAAFAHAVEKAEAMGVALSVHPSMIQELAAASSDRRIQGSVQYVCERLALRPSNGVCEASDFLSDKHDWVQLQEEVTEPINRALYCPSSKARRIEQIFGCL